ncbi:MAG: hypothetical protein ACE5EU_09275, partial [Paracoccaceae bacterium]
LKELRVRRIEIVERRIARARTHVEVAEIPGGGGGDLDDNYDRAAAVTVLAAAVARLTEAAAVIWHTSHRAVSAGELARLTAALAQGQAPVSLWLGRAGRPARAGGAATRGLLPLFGAEIEVEARDLPTDAAFEIACDMAQEVLRSGAPPEDGARLGYDRTTEFGVRYRTNAHPGAAPAVVLSQIARPAGAPAGIKVAASAA